MRSCRPFFALVATLFLLLGCASERKPINKVQANALAKTFFVGDPGDPKDDPEFYARNFVVDGSEAQELVGIGSWSTVDRIKWEISETMLFARRSYGQNPGADNKGLTSGFPNGTIVAAYPITSHFDIKRDYNPQTGEELNVIVENTTDRPWYQRDYFRVDWSMNKVESPDWFDMFLGKVLGTIKVTPVAYYISDPNQDDAPHFETENGYFDITSKFSVEPAGPGVGQPDIFGTPIPSCVWTGFETGNAIKNCDNQEAVIRSSYYRVDKLDQDADFEPFENDRAPQDIFGNPGGQGSAFESGVVTPPRITYDPAYGYTDQGLHRLMHIHNIWKQSHQTRGTCGSDADCGGKGSTCLPSGTCTVPCSHAAAGDASGDGGKGSANGTDDQCENSKTGYRGSAGSQCSVINRCTIPYRDREIKPIRWYVNPEMPGTVQDTVDGSGKRVKPGATEDVVQTWSQALRLAVAHAREVECRRTGGKDRKSTAEDRAECHDLYFEQDPQSKTGKIEMLNYGGWGIEQVTDRTDVAVTCHNPVRDYDPAECGARGSIARVGDVRKNFIFYWPYASRAPWGGIANWNGDPITGQMLGASATVMGRSATFSAAEIRDVLLVANGELGMTDITNGTPAARYEQRLRFGDVKKALPATTIAAQVAGVDAKAAAAAFGFSLSTSPADRQRQINDLKAKTVLDPASLATAYAAVSGVAKPLLGTQYELGALSPGWFVDAAGLSPTSQLDDATLSAVSPLRGADPARQGQSMRALLDGMSSHGACTFAGADAVGNPAVRGVAPWFANRYSDDAIRKQYPKLADIGQLAAQRSQGIYDQLSVETYKGIVLHEIGHALGMFHNWASSYDAVNYDPQYWQLRTNEGLSTASCQSQPRPDSNDTCMGPRFYDPETAEEQGDGSEPRPGIDYFGHTSTMEYQQERFFETVGMGQYDVMTMGALYGRVLETFDPTATDGVPASQQRDYEWLDFTQLTEDDLVAGQPTHYTEVARGIKVFDPKRCRDATKDEIEQGEWRIVHGKVCAPPPKDYAAWQDFVDGLGPKTSVSTSAPVGAGSGNVRWPYRFGQSSDAYVHINPFDSGADIYEVTQHEIERFDYSYPFKYFRRQRQDWDYGALPSKVGEHFFERLRSYHWVAARNNATAASGPLDDVMTANRLAEHDMLQGIARAMLLPQIGGVATADESLSLGNGREIFDAVQGGGGGGFGTPLSLDASSARFVDPDYDTTPQGGGSWNYLDWINHAGFGVEKSNAAMALTDGRPTLFVIQRETYIDGRNVFVNFRTDMARAVDRVIGGVLSNDWDSVAMYLPSGSQDPQMLDFTADAPVRAANPNDVQLLFPNLGYIQQSWSANWAFLFSRLATDLSLNNKLLLYPEGTEGVLDIPDSQKIKFTDPRSGFTYVARLYGPDVIDGKTVDSGVASRMLKHANDLQAFAYQVDRDTSGSPILDPYGRPSLTLDASGNPITLNDTVKTKVYADYVGLVDAVTQIGLLVGHGPGPLPSQNGL